MNSLKVERISISIFRNITPLATREVIPSKVVVRRLDAHLKFCRPQRRCLSTTSAKHIPQLELVESDSFLPPRRPDPRKRTDVEPQKYPPGLPQSCPGCGALTQESEPDQAGYYSASRRIVKRWLRKQRALARASNVDAGQEPEEELEEDNAENDDSQEPQEQEESTAGSIIRTPLCDRCHDLTHNSRGHSIAHPTIDSIADSIAESPFKRNHIYHVIDAADFPMSLVPEIFHKLTLAKPR